MKYAFVGALFAAAAPALSAAQPNAEACYSVSQITTKTIAASPSTVLESVAKLVSANESCACEVVKAAIISTEADKELVAQILDTAITSAPLKISEMIPCAQAVAPDASEEINKVAAKHNYSAKGIDYSAKATGVGIPVDPLNTPGGVPGTPGGGVGGGPSGGDGPVGITGVVTTPPNASKP